MKKTFVLISIFSLFAVFTAAAQTVTVEYMEGIVEVATKSGWEMLNFGDELALNAKIKVDKDSLIELAYNDSRISITQAGTYLVQDLAKSQKQVNSWQLTSLIDWKIKQLAGANADRTQVATAGVRGERADANKDIEWMYMDEDTPEVSDLQQGESLLQAGKYAEAITLLGDLAKKGVAADEEPYLHYYLAYANAANREQITALKEVDKVRVKDDHPLYDAQLLLKGQLLISTLAFNEALDMFHTYLRTNATGETAQSMLILSSYCYKGLNNTSEQKKSLTKAEKLAPDSPLGKEARRLLDSIKN